MANRTSRTSAASTRAIVITTTLVVLVVAVIVSLVHANRSEQPATTALAERGGAVLGAPVPAALLIRPDSHRLGPPAGDRVRFVEFLDFECEACRAAYPSVERLRAEYAGQVDFVARYFPLPGHANAEPAALAVEAAARQGRFEQMYQTMYETQASWGEQQVSHAPTFRGFAERLGLDMAAYDRDVADPAVRDRVLADRDDGISVGVQGTPTIFVNDRPVEGDRSYPALKAAIDQALATP
ncbi:thioredoxin domain-containing protein [Actinomycetospora sp. DW7H6]|uniref:Thioredoxin domain-containing protein n=1 Tax=Actinomycetospora lemnae TaxID=3019891 RepID=A0ABT5SZC0_9PSEU|nr:thioredoxin domain-containing protein [Actinomycetospora sp. DW7H6]